MLRASLRDGPQGLTLEIDDHGILPANEHLPQMKVAVVACQAEPRLQPLQLINDLHDRRPLRSQLRNELAQRSRPRISTVLATLGFPCPQPCQSPLSRGMGRFGPAAKISRADRFGSKLRLDGRRGESPVQFGCASSHRA